MNWNFKKNYKRCVLDAFFSSSKWRLWLMSITNTSRLQNLQCRCNTWTKKTCQNLNSISSSSISTSSSYSSSWPKSASAAKSPSSTSPFLRTTPTFFLVPAMSMGETPLNFGLNQIFWYSETISISNYLRQIDLTPSPTLALTTFLSIAMQWQASLLMFKSRWS